jgi:hypothetical protein
MRRDRQSAPALGPPVTPDMCVVKLLKPLGLDSDERAFGNMLAAEICLSGAANSQ